MSDTFHGGRMMSIEFVEGLFYNTYNKMFPVLEYPCLHAYIKCPQKAQFSFSLKVFSIGKLYNGL